MADSIELATGYVSLAVSTQGMGRQIAQGFKSADVEASKAGKRAGKSFSGGISVAAKAGIGAVAGAGYGAAKGLGAALTAAGDLEQSVGGVQAVFGRYAKQIESSSRAAAKAVGLSRNEYNELANTLGSTLKNKGVKNFTGETKRLIGLGADLSAQFGGSTKEAVEALSSALRGETDPIERYGVSMNQAAIEAEAMRMGLAKTSKDQDKIVAAQMRAEVAQRNYNKAVKEHGKDSSQALSARAGMVSSQAAMEKAMAGTKVQLNDEQKAMAALSLVTRQTASAQGAFGRESDTLQGKQARASAQWKNLTAQIGGAFLPIASRVMGFISDRLIPGLSKLAEKILPEIGGGFKAFSGAFRAADGDVTSSGFPGFMERVANLLTQRVMPVMRVVASTVIPALVAGFRAAAGFIASEVVPRIVGIGQAFAGLARVVAPIVQRIFGALVGAVRQNLPVIQGAFQSIRAIVTDVLDAIRVHIQNVTKVIRYIWDRWGKQITTVAQVAFGVIIKVIGGALKIVSGIVKVVTGLMTGDWRKMGQGFKTIALGVASIQRAIWNGIKTALSAILTALVTSLRAKWQGFLTWTSTKLKAGLAKVKDFVLTPIRAARDAIKGILDQVAKKFDAGVTAIGKAWDGLKAKAKAPIEFVVNTVLNKGLVPAFNKIARAVGIKTRLPSVSYDRGGYTGPGGKYQPAGVVHADEFVVRKESRAKFERDNPGYLDHLNRTGTLPGYAAGGEVKRLQGIMGGLKRAGSGPFAQLATAGARRLGDEAINKVKGALAALVSQVGGKISGAVKGIIGRLGGGGGGIRNLARAMGASLSAHRDPSGLPSFDIFPRGSNEALGDAFYAARKKLGLRYLIWNMKIASAARGWNIRRYTPITTSGDFRHTRHTHVTYDQGGWLQPGLTLAYNGTGKPERIRTHEQEKAVQNGVGGGVNIYGGSFGYDPESIARAWEDERRRKAALVPAW